MQLPFNVKSSKDLQNLSQSELDELQYVVKGFENNFSFLAKNKPSHSFQNIIDLQSNLSNFIIPPTMHKKKTRKLLSTIESLAIKLQNTCKICSINIATTTEHTFKNSLFSKFRTANEELVHYKDGETTTFTNSRSLVKNKKKDLCELCNNIRSKASDNFFDREIEFIYKKCLETAKHYNPIKKFLFGWILDFYFIHIKKGGNRFNSIYALCPRIELLVGYNKSERELLKQYFSKALICQVNKLNCPPALKDAFLYKTNMEKIDFKFFYVTYPFHERELSNVFVKSDVIAVISSGKIGTGQTNEADSIIFEIGIGPLILQIAYNIDLSKITALQRNLIYSGTSIRA